MEELRLCLQPGDRVRLTEDVGKFYDDFPDQTILIGTKGSIGIVVSLDEYRVYYEQQLISYRIEKSEGHEKHIVGVGDGMERCFRYPIRFEMVMSPSIQADLVCCKVGEIELIHVSNGYSLVLEKVE